MECTESGVGGSESDRESVRSSQQDDQNEDGNEDEDNPRQEEIGIAKKQKKKRKKGKKRGGGRSGGGGDGGTSKNAGGAGAGGGGGTTARPTATSTVVSAKSPFAQIAKELKARRLAQMAHAAAMAKKRKKKGVLRDEEVYTDKDRAAAVNMGTSDIKQSLKIKKRQNKNFDFQGPDEGDPATILALGNNELRNGNMKTALKFINKALELNPDDKNGLVARSKCYLSLGDPQLALNDAETALVLDKGFVRAIYQKAEALYHLGDFEHSLMYYHRGHRIRPELESFRLGVQKAQEAIENTIGGTSGLKTRRKTDKTLSSGCSSAKVESHRNEKSASDKSSNEADTKRSVSSGNDSDKGNRTSRTRSRSAAPVQSKSSSRRFLGELDADRLYLESLLRHPDLICSSQDAANLIKVQAEEGIMFLKNRQEFWRQQKPSSAAGGKRLKENRM